MKSDAAVKGQEFLTWNDMQGGIDMVNMQVEEEHKREYSGSIIWTVVFKSLLFPEKCAYILITFLPRCMLLAPYPDQG